MSKLELKIIGIFALIKTDSIRTWHLANFIYFDCMSKPDRRNGGRVSAICRAANRSKFLKLEGETVHFNEEGWPDK